MQIWPTTNPLETFWFESQREHRYFCTSQVSVSLSFSSGLVFWLTRKAPPQSCSIAQSAHLKFCLNLSQLPPRQHLDVGAHLEMRCEFSRNTFSPTKNRCNSGNQVQFWESFFFTSSHLANTVAIVGCKYKYCLMGTCLRVLVLPVLSLMYRAINSFRPEGWMSKFSYSTESWILQLLPRTEEVGN